MGVWVANAWGDSVDSPTERELRDFLDRIDPGDEEHGAAWMETDAGWGLEMSADGVMTLSRKDAEPVHLVGVTKERALELWRMLSAENYEGLLASPWHPGARPPTSREEQQRRAWENAAALLEMDQDFFARLGLERSDVRCKREGCERGAISHSVLCRRHHFESIRGRPCPFDD